MYIVLYTYELMVFPVFFYFALTLSRVRFERVTRQSISSSRLNYWLLCKNRQKRSTHSIVYATTKFRLSAFERPHPIIHMVSMWHLCIPCRLQMVMGSSFLSKWNTFNLSYNAVVFSCLQTTALFLYLYAIHATFFLPSQPQITRTAPFLSVSLSACRLICAT